MKKLSISLILFGFILSIAACINTKAFKYSTLPYNGNEEYYKLKLNDWTKSIIAEKDSTYIICYKIVKGGTQIQPIPVSGYEEINTRIIYPEISKKTGMEGNVMLFYRVNKFGIVDTVHIEKSAGEPNNLSAITALKETKFIPSKVNGVAVDSYCLSEIVFSLNSKSLFDILF